MVPTPRWGTGGVLSDLQLRVARIIAGLVEAEDFALAGGAALIVRGDVERATRDLDFFGTRADAVDHLVPAAESALQQAGFQVERLIESPGFTRFVVASELDRTEVLAAPLSAHAVATIADHGSAAPVGDGGPR